MELKNIINLKNAILKKKNIEVDDYKIYTPEMVKKYRECYKFTMKVTKHRDKTMFIMLKKAEEWYQNENINYNIEKVHIKTKLGSYTSGGCGIGASLLAGLTASGVFSYMDIYVKKLGAFSLMTYALFLLFFGFKILQNEDDNVEMYNIFLEAINEIESQSYDKFSIKNKDKKHKI
ncbi:MAG: hypothetical protein E7207_00890 [Clostridium butyricum]|nr:hypothetical protein [Clostridium butyricum]